MNKTFWVAIPFLLVLAQAFGQDKPAALPESRAPFSTWSMYFADVRVAGRNPYVIGVLTPTKPIVIRRVELLSNKGPVDSTNSGLFSNGEPGQCRAQFVLQLTDGMSVQNIPISNVFVTKKSSQTYTDTGVVAWRFSAGNRISIAIIDPKQQFPPANCTFFGANVTVQYDSGDEPNPEKSE